MEFKLAKDYFEIGSYSDMIKKYPYAEYLIDNPAVASIPNSATMAIIYARSLIKWNNHIHEPILVDNIAYVCIGCIEVIDKHRSRTGAILLSLSDYANWKST